MTSGIKKNFPVKTWNIDKFREKLFEIATHFRQYQIGTHRQYQKDTQYHLFVELQYQLKMLYLCNVHPLLDSITNI